MGQQQLLLIVVGLIIIAIAIIIGIDLFTASSAENKRDLVINECVNLATLAQQYYKKPTILGGGGNSFSGWQIPNGLKQSINGSFTEQVSADQIIITGTGTEIVSGTDSVKVEMTVTPTSYQTVIIN
jgi:hypothetical protein